MAKLPLENTNFAALKKLRRQLHQQPELSGQEAKTAESIESFLRDTKPDHIIRQLGGNGIAFIYDSGQPGPSIGFRCELDALPIQETNNWEHSSDSEGVSHKCGHDGHMAILAGLGLWLKENPFPKGKVLLLFQPAEETGEGAHSVVNDPRWKDIRPEWMFGLHNIPGFTEGTILAKDGAFCAASKGMLLKLQGTTSHAAEPEKGNNPSRALARIMLDLQALPENGTSWKQQVLLTPVYAHLGEKAFGTSAGAAEFGATLRSFEETDMQTLTNQAETLIREHATSFHLEYDLQYQEVFPATENLPAANAYVRKVIQEAEIPLLELDKAFRWSEDFGWYAKECKTAFVGLGAGEKQPALHHPDYDFPDQILEPGVQFFVGLVKEFNF